MQSDDDIRHILEACRFNDWQFDLRHDDGRPYLQLRWTGACNRTGKIQGWQGRKWPLSPEMNRSEIVQTAFKAVMTALEHEAREAFTYKGAAVFGPHFDVDRLATLCRRQDAAFAPAPPPFFPLAP